jgi:hypothetical protein
MGVMSGSGRSGKVRRAIGLVIISGQLAISVAACSGSAASPAATPTPVVTATPAPTPTPVPTPTPTPTPVPTPVDAKAAGAAYSAHMTQALQWMTNLNTKSPEPSDAEAYQIINTFAKDELAWLATQPTVTCLTESMTKYHDALVIAQSWTQEQIDGHPTSSLSPYDMGEQLGEAIGTGLVAGGTCS